MAYRGPDREEFYDDSNYGPDNTYLIDDERTPDQQEEGRSKGASHSGPQDTYENIEKLFDIPEKFSIPDTSADVDPMKRFSESDFSSHRNFDPGAKREKKKKHRKRKNQQSRDSTATDMTETSVEGDTRPPPIPSHAVQDIFADDPRQEASRDVMFSEYGAEEHNQGRGEPQGPSREREPHRPSREREPQGPSRERETDHTRVQRRGQQQRSPYPDDSYYPGTADYDDIAAHRAHSNARNYRRSRRQRRSLQAAGMSASNSKYDHTPHEVFVELHELENEEMQWREKARWIKFEENVEEGTGRWGKPHVANLSFLQLIELRKYLESGSVLLDIEDQDMSSIFHRIVDNLVLSDQVNEGDRGEILRALFYDHLHVQESRGLVKDLISMRPRGRSMSRRPTLGRSQRHNTGNYDSGYRNNQPGLSNQEQQDLRHLKHSKPPEVGVKFANGGQNADVNIPIVQNEDPSMDEPAPQKKKGKQKRNREEPPSLHRRMTMEQGNVLNKSQDIMKKIPADAEGVAVLVGEMNCLERPVLSFVRLSEGTQLDGLTEIPIPVRFVFVLLGPGGCEVDYYEIGRCFSTLMSSESFNETAYTAENMKELLSAMNRFIGETMVLPAGNWDKELLMPVLRKHKRLRQEAGFDDSDTEDEEEGLVVDGKKTSKNPAALINPLERTRRPFGGLWYDIRRRYPFYLSDFKDALNGQCLAAVVFIFFAALSPAITFGGLLGEKTENWMGISEMILGSAICGVVFALFSGQPLVIIGVTGPILVFEENLFKFCKSMDIEYLPFRFWTGCWLCLIATVCVAAEGSVLVRYISRFTEEIFSFLISIIFIYEVFNKLVQIYFQHPLLTTEDYCNGNNDTSVGEVVGPVTDSLTAGWGVSLLTTAAPDVNKTGALCAAKEPPKSNQPNTALLSTILMFGTYLLANQLKVFKNSHYLGKSARKLLADFGIPIAIMVMVGKDLAITTVYTTKLDVPNGLVPTDACKRGWFVNPMGTEKPFPIMWMAGSIIPALLAFILMFMETLITELIVNKKDNRLKKGGGFHLDLFLLGILAAFNGLLGLPWVWSATVRSVTHLGALTVFSTTHAPGEKPRLEMVREQRVTGFLVNLLIGLSIALAPILKRVPLAVLFGVFLFMGVSSLNGVQFADRVFMLAMPVKHHPDVKYVRNVRTWRMHMYTIIQLGGVAMLWGVKISPAALAFPFFLIILVPIRKLLGRIFTEKELDALDCADAGEDEVEEAVEVVVPT